MAVEDHCGCVLDINTKTTASFVDDRRDSFLVRTFVILASHIS